MHTTGSKSNMCAYSYQSKAVNFDQTQAWNKFSAPNLETFFASTRTAYSGKIMSLHM